MKKINLKDRWIGANTLSKYILIAACFILLGGCTKNFENMNTSNAGITKAQLQPDFNFIGQYYPSIQQHIFGEEGDYQLCQNLNSDCYAGYYMSPDPFRGNINNQSYSLVDGWNTDVFGVAYGSVVGPITINIKSAARTAYPHFWAIALILEVQTISRVTDYYGPIPYTKEGTAGATTPYDSQQVVYNTFFAQLDTAVSNLTAYTKANPGLKPFTKFDMVYGGDYTQWIKYANSLRLRLAMHIVNIDPVTAKAQALKAINDPGGLILANNDNAAINGILSYHNPIWWIGTSWTDLAVGASLTSYLSGYNDPRTPKMISPASSPAGIVGQYVGIRAGTPVGGKPMYSGYSQPNYDVISEYSPMILINAAEVWFLKSEIALRGWTTESAQTDYETGITTSMAQWGVSAGSYLTDKTSTQADYVDPLTPSAGTPNASIKAMSKITIAWDATATNEQNLERIITQKWIANFPSGGWEAWTDYRRTGYPRLFPVVVNNSGGTINTALQIRRIAYPSTEYTSNASNVAAAVTLLGGPDNGGTPIWWDTNKGQATPKNF
ncbi:Susd and RagB outer membrane lipoprotein [Mucilaginibacter mallensis]|uniref:Susd and RagB outer membrane lipoprotein n=1 Tax=Mucilaginibacter mallensis TaxID=652787 RepID=A0A1H2B0Q4_MUCMA|nr:SusD/RagB family nutrient-binding outer membrane lipoprotein [Mucilaginibacter mallensis]SDT51771.1 Susd and RagB outer membrane lipoprotein [Mucilaginibacter mallensis]